MWLHERSALAAVALGGLKTGPYNIHAALGESERTQRGIAAIEAIGGYGVSKRKIAIWGESRSGEAHYSTKLVY